MVSDAGLGNASEDLLLEGVPATDFRPRVAHGDSDLHTARNLAARAKARTCQVSAVMAASAEYHANQSIGSNPAFVRRRPISGTRKNRLRCVYRASSASWPS